MSIAPVFLAKGPGVLSLKKIATKGFRQRLRAIWDRNSALRWHTSSASSSNPEIVADLFRLIPPNERAAFRKMLEYELRGRELPDGKLRRLAERAWHKFLRYGWPAAK